MEALESNITLLAGGNISLNNEHSYFYYRDEDKAADERLTLKAGGNIGSAERPILLDMAETLYIQAAMDYFIRAEALIPDPNLNPGEDVLFHRVIRQDVVHSGYDADGNFVSGEYLVDGNPLTEQINAALEIQTNEEIAKWLAGRVDRAQASSILTRDALARLITSGVLTKTSLVALLAGDNRNIKKQVNAIFEQPTAAQTLADMLLGKMAEQANGTYTMDNGQLTQIFKGAMDGGELQPAGKQRPQPRCGLERPDIRDRLRPDRRVLINRDVLGRDPYPGEHVEVHRADLHLAPERPLQRALDLAAVAFRADAGRHHSGHQQQQ
jgi:hypothetical protein